MRRLAWWRTEGEKLTKSAKRRGESIDHCGTPEEGINTDENEPRTEI